MIYQREHYCLIGLDLSLCEMPLVQKAVLQCLLHHPDLQVQKGKTYEIKNYL
jgi:hypothetical protein